MEQMLEGEAERLIRKLLELALNGDLTALRLCMERLVPPRKDRSIQLDLPPTRTLREVSTAITAITAAICEGQITPNEGDVLSNILTVQKNLIVTEELERRLEEVEETVKLRKKEEVGQ